MKQIERKVSAETIAFIIASIKENQLFSCAVRENMEVIRNQFESVVGLWTIHNFFDIWNLDQDKPFDLSKLDEFNNDLFEQKNTIELLYIVTALHNLSQNSNLNTATQYANAQEFIESCEIEAYMVVKNGLFKSYSGECKHSGGVPEIQKAVFHLVRPLMDSISINLVEVLFGSKGNALEMINIADSTMDWVLNLNMQFANAPTSY